MARPTTIHGPGGQLPATRAVARVVTLAAVLTAGLVAAPSVSVGGRGGQRPGEDPMVGVAPGWRSFLPDPPGGFVAGGSASGARVRTSDRTRWAQAKAALERLGRAYVDKDLAGFLSAFSSQFAQDMAVLRQAVLDDFQRDDDLRLDFELLEFRVTFSTIQARIRWIRSANPRDGRATQVLTGESTLLFDRHEGFRLKAWRGLPAFGVRDRQFLALVAAGDDDALEQAEENAEQVEPSNSSSGGTGAATLFLSPNPIVLGAGDQGIEIDFEAGTAVAFSSVPAGPPGTDILIERAGPPAGQFQVKSFALDPGIALCPPSVTSPGDMKEVDPFGFASAEQGNGSGFFGAVGNTTIGLKRYNLFRVNWIPGAGSVVTITVEYFPPTPGTTVNPSGTETCS